MANSTAKQDQELRDKVNSIDQSLREVIKPTLEGVAKNIEDLSGRGFITEEKADKKYATKEQIKRMEILFWGIVSAILLGIVNFVFKLLEKQL